MPRLNSAAELDSFSDELVALQDANATCVTICSGTGCHASRSDKVYQAFVGELEQQGLDADVDIRRTGCHGLCEKGTIVTILPQEVTYLQVRPDDVPRSSPSLFCRPGSSTG